LAELA